MTRLSDVRGRLDELLRHPRAQTKAVRKVLADTWQLVLDDDLEEAAKRLDVLEAGIRERDASARREAEAAADAENRAAEAAHEVARREAEATAEAARLTSVLGKSATDPIFQAITSGKVEFAESQIQKLQRFLEEQQVQKDGRSLPMRWTGTWSELLEYVPGDVVELEGIAYVATATTRSKPPSSAWDIIVRRGETMQILGGGGGGFSAPGATGPTGPAGADGATGPSGPSGPSGPAGTGGGGGGGLGLGSLEFSQDVGNGSDSTFTVTHGLGTRDVVVAVYRSDDGAEVLPDVSRVDADTVALDFGIEVPDAAEYRVIVVSGDSTNLVWMPLTTVIGGVPELVWDGDGNLIPTLEHV